MAAVEAGKEIKWMRNILTEFGYPPSYASTFFIDNKSGIEVTKNPEHHGHIKHLNVADLFTKAVQSQVIRFTVPKLGSNWVQHLRFNFIFLILFYCL